jgi:hypothetical protein
MTINHSTNNITDQVEDCDASSVLPESADLCSNILHLKLTLITAVTVNAPSFCQETVEARHHSCVYRTKQEAELKSLTLTEEKMNANGAGLEHSV